MGLRFVVLLMVAVATALAGKAQAQAQVDPPDRRAIVGKLCGPAAALGEAGTALLARSMDASRDERLWAGEMARAVLDRKLACDEETAGAAALVDTAPARDAMTLEPKSAPAKSRTPVLNLRSRSTFEVASAALALRTAQQVAARAEALRTLERRVTLLPEGLLEAAAETEPDAGLRMQLLALQETAELGSKDIAKRIAAVGRLAETATRRTLSRLTELRADSNYKSDAAFQAAVEQAVAKVQRGVAIGDVLTMLYSGLSYASILFMAAIGLAIIFGLMGVINLAQGELLMIGAYATWLTQEGLRWTAPWLLDWYLIAAIPIAFLASAVVGVTLEVLLLRHLYRRPLMSLLATWAVSLLLMNLVRVTFGTQNLQFDTPFYVTGGIPMIGDFIVTWNRLFASVFALATLVLTWLIVRRTPLGLNIRAVTQNRDMAGCVGIPTRRVDMLAFGLGSGLAGLAGLALSPIYSVNPQMGQNFIIDSFMVVVLGGVGTITGTVAAALGVGQINVLIEPFYGAVAAKVIVLLMIIGFLQWRPEGLFTIAGRRK
jgi:urea transport system permease protein